MKAEGLKPKILSGRLFPEPVQVIMTVPMGASIKLIAKGKNTKIVYARILVDELNGRLEHRWTELQRNAGARSVTRTKNLRAAWSRASKAKTAAFTSSPGCHTEDPETAIDVRFIEVKGRAVTGEIALTSNEYHSPGLSALYPRRYRREALGDGVLARKEGLGF